MSFTGYGYDAAQDYSRLKSQQNRLLWILEKTRGEWWSVQDLSRWVPGAQTSLSANIRNLRKKQHGSHPVECRRLKKGGGTWVYRLPPKKDEK